ncbi:MAG: hypothetical protein GTO02_20205 [Candidatus Dadabacteria bacterium]|nr:hypothetical protein [Candidatus Dadabacteria bacterium]NIQ16620.1 hypothetical protein [Candidatus Dadabacteria bacterium]
MSNSSDAKSVIIQFNKEVDNFFDENSKRIACVITSAVSYTYQPLIVAYQKYFNLNVINIYDSKAFYAHSHDLPNFIYTYFILTKENKDYDPKIVKEHCDIYVKNFIEFNEKVFTAISAQIYDVGKFEILENINRGDFSSLKDVGFLNKP